MIPESDWEVIKLSFLNKSVLNTATCQSCFTRFPLWVLVCSIKPIDTRFLFFSHINEHVIGCSLEANSTEWKQLQGRLILLKAPSKVSVYLEGPPSGTDILVDSFYVRRASNPEPEKPPVITVSG